MRGIFVILALLMLAAPAHAAFKGPGATEGVNSVSKALTAAEDTPCVMEGNILSKVAGSADKYIFKDQTGQMVVEIDSKVFAGRDVTPATVVLLQGKVDAKTMSKNELDVKVLEVIVP